MRKTQSFRFGRKSKKRLKTVNVAMQRIAIRALELSAIDFGIPPLGGRRSTAEQYRMFVDGDSQLDGTRRKSYHQKGLALDVYAYVDGKASYAVEHLALIACAFLQAANELDYKLTWGGHWQHFVDMPHFQIEEGGCLSLS